MADTDKTVTYAIDGNAEGFLAAAQKARAAGVEAAKGIEGAFAGLGGVFKSVQGAFGSMLAVFAGGAAFKAAVDATKEWGAETGKLSKQLQITAAEATAYQVAARHLGIEASTLVDASDKMARQLSKNEDAFKTLGLETRNANGSWRSTGELLPEVMDKLRGIGNQTQQNIAGQQLFGKSWGEVRGLLKLSGEEMEKARQKAKDLHLETDPKQVAKYKEAMNDIKLIMSSLSVQVGNALLPVLTDLGKWFGEVGPFVAGAFSVALKVVQSTVTALWGVVKGIVSGLAGLVAAMVEVIQGNYGKAWGILKDAGKTSFEAVAEGFDAAAEVWQPKGLSKAIPKSDGGKFIDFGTGGNDAQQSQMKAWEATLEERKLKLQEQAQAEGRFYEMSKADEVAYWRDKLALTEAGSNDQVAVRKKVAAIGLEIIKHEYDTQVATLEAQAQAYRHNLDERRAIIEQEAALVAQKYGQHSKEYEAVQAKLTALAREATEQRMQLDQVAADRRRALQLAQLDAEQADLQLQLNLQRTTHAEFLQAEQTLEARRYQVSAQALQDRLALLQADPDRNPVAIAQAYAQVEQLEQQHQQRLQQIRNQATQEQAKYSAGLMDGLRGGFEGVFNQIGRGITSVTGLMRAMFSAVLTALQSMLAKMAAEWLLNMVRNKVSTLATALGQIQANAAVAGSAGTASMAAAPFPLNLAAPEFGASMAALSAGYAAGLTVPSAAGGWEVPRDTLAMVHEREMILPAKYSDVIRAMADNNAGAGAAGGGGDGLGGLRVVPMPGDFWMVHRQDLLKATDRAARDKLRR